jgi:splicing factor 45
VPRSLRPGQKGFAERLLAKYGWTKGSGLGATGSGIAKPLQVKVEKQKKRPDSEGGGFATPAGRGKIIGGKRKGGEDEGKFGAMTEVIVLRGMLDGMDLEAELAGEGGGLMQEIGEECSEKVFFPSPFMSQPFLILMLCAVRKRGTSLHRPRCG